MSGVLRRAEGFSLIEMLITVAVVAITSLGIATLLTNLSGSIASTNASFDVAELRKNLMLALSTRDACQTGFISGPAGAGHPFVKAAASEQPMRAPSGALIAGAGQEVALALPGGELAVAGPNPLPGYKLRVDGLRLSDMMLKATSGNVQTWIGKLTLYVSPAASSASAHGQPLDARGLGSIALTIDAVSGAATKCSSTGTTEEPPEICVSLGGKMVAGSCVLSRPPSTERIGCVRRSWGSKSNGGSINAGGSEYAGDALAAPLAAQNDWALCPMGTYLAGTRGTGVSESDKRDYGEIVCCSYE